MTFTPLITFVRSCLKTFKHDDFLPKYNLVKPPTRVSTELPAFFVAPPIQNAKDDLDCFHFGFGASSFYKGSLASKPGHSVSRLMAAEILGDVTILPPNFMVLDLVFPEYKFLSHALFYDQIEKKVVISFGRKNGPSNLVEYNEVDSEGKRVNLIGCPEKWFQAYKAATSGNESKAEEVFAEKHGFSAKRACNAKGLSLTEEQRKEWDSKSFLALFQSNLPRLLDPSFGRWMAALHAFSQDNGVEILFVEVGDETDIEYTCGMMGDKIYDCMIKGGFQGMKESFGVDQEGGVTKNKAGVIMNLLLEIVGFMVENKIPEEQVREMCDSLSLFSWPAPSPKRALEVDAEAPAAKEMKRELMELDSGEHVNTLVSPTGVTRVLSNVPTEAELISAKDA